MLIHTDEVADDALAFASSLARILEHTPRWLECRYLYDAQGSTLFDAITKQPEYYQTRTEDRILRDNASRIREVVGDRVLSELGSGNSSKTQHLLDAWTARGRSAYVPLDLSTARPPRSLQTAWIAIPRSPRRGNRCDLPSRFASGKLPVPRRFGLSWVDHRKLQ